MPVGFSLFGSEKQCFPDSALKSSVGFWDAYNFLPKYAMPCPGGTHESPPPHAHLQEALSKLHPVAFWHCLKSVHADPDEKNNSFYPIPSVSEIIIEFRHQKIKAPLSPRNSILKSIIICMTAFFTAACAAVKGSRKVGGFAPKPLWCFALYGVRPGTLYLGPASL